MKLFLKILIGVSLGIIAYMFSGAWNEYYLSIADKRFDSWMIEGSWRGEMSQYNNARLGVLMEWLFGHAAIWFIAALFFGGMVSHIKVDQTKQ